MSYQVIARKYRPQRFSEVVGQEHVTQTLGNAIAQSRIAHAYLFVGPRGTGKTTIARIFAKCLNCTGGPKIDYPDDDPRANEIAEGRSLDVLEIDGASNRGIDEIRELRDTVKYAPASSKFKIYIIDEVHMLTKEAFNALLKTLEEPPEHVKFMFATTEPEKVLPTILSRCQRFDLRRIPTTLIVKHLSEIAAKENVQIDEPALHAIARGAEGGMRDAESTLDQLISFCGNKIQETDVLSMFGLAARGQLLALAQAIINGNGNSALRELNELARNGKDLGRLLSDLLSYFRNLMVYQFSKGDFSLMDVSEGEAAAIAKDAAQIPSDAVTRVLEVLAEGESKLREAASKKIFLEITLLKAIEARNSLSIDAVLKKLQQLRGEPSGNGGGGQSAAPALRATQAPATPEKPAAAGPDLNRVQSNAAEPASQPHHNEPAPSSETRTANSANSFEQPTANLELPSPPNQPLPLPLSPLGERDRVRGIGDPYPPASPIAAPHISPAAPATPAPDPFPQTANPDLENLWSQLIEAVGRVSPFMRTYLLESHPVGLTKTSFTIGFDPEFKDHLGLVDNLKNRTVIETKLREIGYRDVSVRFIQAEAPPGRARPVKATEQEKPRPVVAQARSNPTASAAPAPIPGPVLSKEDFKNDPLIKKALEIFKGTIVEVRA